MRSKSQILSKLRADGHITDEEYKVLGQEPILDKIRAEIRNLDDINPDYPMDRTIHINRNEVLNIIDKYRQEG